LQVGDRVAGAADTLGFDHEAPEKELPRRCFGWARLRLIYVRANHGRQVPWHDLPGVDIDTGRFGQPVVAVAEQSRVAASIQLKGAA
jgi:hypothetical protein